MSRTGNRDSTSIHISLQGKGGVGKSLVSSILSQYLLSKGENVRAIDADPVNQTLAEYPGLGVSRLNLLKDGSVDQREFDLLVLRLAQHEVVGHIERDARKAGAAVREEIQKDIDSGRLHARELIVELNRAYSRSAVRRWVAVGVISASALLLLGVGLGVLLAKVLK